MSTSPERARRALRRGHLARLRDAFEWLMRLAPGARRRAARREFARDPAFLREVLELVEAETPSGSFLAPPAAPVAVRREARVPEIRPGRLFGHRWRVVRPLDRGGQGVVWEARDETTGEDAVVKVMLRGPGSDVVRVSRESAMLRWLRLPGVVHLLGDGTSGDSYWVAMERVRGVPFPGALRARGWERVEPLATALLETLARIHAAGVVHGDLKPQNVLVGRDGVLTVLDLGLASAISGGAWRGTGGGTPGYMAPECAFGAPPTVLSDLYSAGVLIAKALTGRASPRRLGARRLPNRVRRTLDRLVAQDPSERPSSSAEALRLLLPPRRTRRTRPWTRTELRSRFRGHDLFHHIREDAARQLHRLTDGHPGRVEEELASWARGGLARVEDGLAVVDRVSLERISALSAPPRGVSRNARTGLSAPDVALTRALRGGDPSRVVRTALRAARSAMDAGRSVRALSALDIAAVAARDLGRRGDLREALRRSAWAALATGTTHEIERALWIVNRSGAGDEVADGLASVLRAAADVHTDRATAWRISSRAVRHPDAEVRRMAWAVRSLVSQGLDLAVQRRTVRESALWARRDASATARRLARLFRAWLLYREGRCALAARLHLDSARRARHPADRSRSLVDAATAALDAGDTATALELAKDARPVAARLRLPVREVRAYGVARRALDRLGTRLRPDLAALAAIDDLGFGVLRWTVRMGEAVIAWRQGDQVLAREILSHLAIRSDPARLSLHEIPVVCLAVALGEPCDASRADALARRAVRQMAPGYSVQCLALLALGGADRRMLRRRLATLRLPRRGREFTRAREVFSVKDALSILATR